MMTREEMITKIERLDLSGVGVEVVNSFANKDYYFYEDFETSNGLERARRDFLDLQEKEEIQSFKVIDGAEEKARRKEACKRLEKYNIPVYDTKWKKDLLARMKSDCDYFLQEVDKKEKRLVSSNEEEYLKMKQDLYKSEEQYLWAGNVSEQLEVMKDLYKSIPPSNRPEWTSLEDISLYQDHMIVKPQYDRILMGEDLNGSKENAMDLEVAQVTGKDLDGVNIPNDTPEERNTEKRKNIKELKEEAKKIVEQKAKRKASPHIEKKGIDR